MIEFRGVHFSYRSGETVLQAVNLEIPAGLTLLLGPNGSGKSTLLKLAAGVERPDRGETLIGGLDLWKQEVAARRGMAYVPEQPDLTPYATILDVLFLVCRLRSEPLERGREALRLAGLSQMADRSIRELSMGQRRRAVLAAAWIGSPDVVLLDEPLEALDRAIREEILFWLDRLLSRGATVLIATHEIEPFVTRTSRAVGVGKGRCRMQASLPEDETERMVYFESLARGG